MYSVLFSILAYFIALVVANAFMHAHVINNVMNPKDEDENKGWHTWTKVLIGVFFASTFALLMFLPDGIETWFKLCSFVWGVSTYVAVRWLLFDPILNYRRGLPINARGYDVMPFFVRTGICLIALVMLCGLFVELVKIM